MKKRLILNFTEGNVEEPITYFLIKNYDLLVNILKAEIYPEEGGNLLMEMEGDEKTIKKSINYLKSRNVEVVNVDRKIHFREEDCIYCGSCTAVCCTGSLSIDKKTWKIVFNKEKCLVCGLCAEACPLSLFEVSFGN
ncbi:MAG: 4Fe-4S binding protein [Candidatus Coatesbacteria bacterium]|nr:4Fe-4S binding protein [Candidatus Coatesbacteria bacterium]